MRNFKLLLILAILIVSVMTPSFSDVKVEIDSTGILKDFIKENYYIEVEDAQLTEGMIRGMFEILDPYSAYLSKQEMTDLLNGLNNSFEGVGLYLIEDKPYVRVQKVIPDSPAAKAGILTDDIIVKVNSETIRGQSLEVVVSRIKGSAGTEVQLGILRTGRSGELSFNLTRQKITIKSVTTKMLSGDVGYIKLEDFGEDADNQVRYTLANFQSLGITDIVLDLRGNPGGYLDVAVDIASTFLPAGAEIVTIDYRREPDVVEKARLSGFSGKVAVLIDANSASASEVLAAALKGRDNVKLFGETTYGKGTVQEVRRFLSGDGIKITVAEYYGPNGLKINDIGVAPDVYIESVRSDLTQYENLAPFYDFGTLQTDQNHLVIYALQQRLRILGYPVAATGIYDAGTKNAILNYEESNNLPADGILDAALKKSVDRSIYESYNLQVMDQPLHESLNWLKSQ